MQRHPNQYANGKRWCRTCYRFVIIGNKKRCPSCNRLVRFARRNKKRGQYERGRGQEQEQEKKTLSQEI